MKKSSKVPISSTQLWQDRPLARRSNRTIVARAASRVPLPIAFVAFAALRCAWWFAGVWLFNTLSGAGLSTDQCALVGTFVGLWLVAAHVFTSYANRAGARPLGRI